MTREVLVALPYDGGRAEVVRDGRGTLLVGSVEQDGGTEIRDAAAARMALEGVAGGRFVVGGLLPPGAVRAVAIAPSGEPVEAVCGGGAWLAIGPSGDFDAPPVRFDDAAGEPVRPALPEAWPREPVADTTVACFACGASEWERITPTDFSRGSHRRGGGPEEPTPVIACVRCGHEERQGAWFGGEHPVPDQEQIRRHRERRRREEQRVLGGVDFTVYALVAAAAPELGGWGTDIHRVTEVTLRYDGVEVTSAFLSGGGLEDPVQRARDAFFASAGRTEEDWPELSPAALTLLIRERERRRVAALMTARPASVEIDVDGQAVPFTAFGTDGSWAMAANLDGAYVTIRGAGRPLDSVALTVTPGL
jgi:hypothetical protein